MLKITSDRHWPIAYHRKNNIISSDWGHAATIGADEDSMSGGVMINVLGE